MATHSLEFSAETHGRSIMGTGVEATQPTNACVRDSAWILVGDQRGTSMSSQASGQFDDITMRQAALVAGFSLLVMSVLSPVAFFTIFPKLVVRSSIEQTVQNLAAHPGLFVCGLLCYLITFIADVVVAWALVVFLKPVNVSLAWLAGWFRLAYAAVAMSALLKLVSVYRLLNSSDALAVLGLAQRNAQAYVLLMSFRYEWSFSMIVFAVHLLVLSYLVYRSGYVPKLIGILLAVNGAAYLLDTAQPFLGMTVPYLFIAFFGELIFMVWLFLKGGKKEMAAPRHLSGV